MKKVSEEHPPAHAIYRVQRDGVEFHATPCYGIHNPWWIPRNGFTREESAPAIMCPNDLWEPIRFPVPKETNMREIRHQCPFSNNFKFKCRYRYPNKDCVDLGMCPAITDSWCHNQIRVARLLDEAVDRSKLYNEGR